MQLDCHLLALKDALSPGDLAAAFPTPRGRAPLARARLRGDLVAAYPSRPVGVLKNVMNAYTLGWRRPDRGCLAADCPIATVGRLKSGVSGSMCAKGRNGVC